MKKRVLSGLLALFLLLGCLTLPAGAAEAAFLGPLPEFFFSSGAGAWATTLTVNQDGSFQGEYSDTDIEQVNGVSYGKISICQFSGKFTDIQRVDFYTYSMRVASLTTVHQKGETWTEKDCIYVAADPYGIPDVGGEVLLYLPGHDASTLPQAYREWYERPKAQALTGMLPCFGLYNVSGQYGFSSGDTESSKALAQWELSSNASSLPFQDVAAGSPYYDSIAYVYQNGLFSGTSSTAFSPSGTMTRAMLVTVLHRLEGKPAVPASYYFNDFNDVDHNSYYAAAVSWASARGIVTGTGSPSHPVTCLGVSSSKTYSPQSSITYQQMAVLLYRYAVLYHGADAFVTVNLDSYPNGNQVSSYAKNAVAWCISKGIMDGKTLTPNQNVTRAEVASMLYQLSKLPQNGGGYQQTVDNLLKQGGRSMYYDADGDGTEELFVLYNGSGYQRAAVYTMRNGQAVRLLDTEAYVVAGGPFSVLSTVTKEGSAFVCLAAGNYAGGIDEEGNGADLGTYRIYRFSGAGLSLEQTVSYSFTDGQEQKGRFTLTEHDQTRNLDYAGYLAWVNSWTWTAQITG